jgi:predicted RNA binding protein YcfA (HicA-like mRNA interferase family)
MNARRLFAKLANNQANVRFAELVRLAEAFGFHLERSEGSHFIYRHSGVREHLNLQSVHGKAKPYQVRQLLKLIEVYNLSPERAR